MIMPISHVFEEFSCYDLIKQIPHNVTEQLGLLLMTGPGTFMMCLGFGIIFSRNSTPIKLFLRGISMFVIQIILNLFRFTLPHWFAGTVLCCPDLINDGIDFFLYSDILPFAGFTFIFFALVKKFNLSNIMVFIIAIICTAGQMLIPQIYFDETYKNLLCGYFFYIDETSFFPFISWIIYPIGGYLLGNILVQVRDKAKFYLKLGGISLFIFVLVNFYLLSNGLMKADFYCFMETGFRMDFWTTAIVLPSIGIYTCLVYLCSNLIKGKLVGLITNISKNINSIYCIHWVIVKWFWAFSIIFTIKLNYNYIFIIGIFIFIMSAIIANFWQKRQKLLLP